MPPQATPAEQGNTQILSGTVHKIIDLTMRDVGDSKDACFLHFDRLGLLKADHGCWMMYAFQGFDPWGLYPMESLE